jgi:hypothetical protein
MPKPLPASARPPTALKPSVDQVLDPSPAAIEYRNEGRARNEQFSGLKRKATSMHGTPGETADPQPRKALSTHTRFFDDGSTRIDHEQRPDAGFGSGSGDLDNDTATTALLRGQRRVTDSKGNELVSDSHFHPTNYAQRGISPRQTLEWMDKMGVRNTVLMPIPTSIISPTVDAERDNRLRNHHCGPTYYIPPEYNDVTSQTMTPAIRSQIVAQSELINDSVVDHAAAFDLHRAQLTEAERSRFDPMITGLHMGADMNTDELLKKLFQNKGVFTGIGEVTLHKELVEEMFAGSTQANLIDHVQPFKDLAEVAGVIGMPMVLHCDVDSLDNQPLRGNPGYTPQHLQGLKSLFSSPELADTTVVWAHAGGLGRFVTEPDDHTNELQQMLDANENLHVDISWSQVASQLTQPHAIDRWAAMIEKNPDRFLIGSDALAPASPAQWEQTFTIYRQLVDKLSPEARHKLLNGNYQRVFVDARQKVREFEDKVLDDQFYDANLKAKDGPRATAEWLRPYAEAKRADGQ